MNTKFGDHRIEIEITASKDDTLFLREVISLLGKDH